MASEAWPRYDSREPLSVTAFGAVLSSNELYPGHGGVLAIGSRLQSSQAFFPQEVALMETPTAPETARGETTLIGTSIVIKRGTLVRRRPLYRWPGGRPHRPERKPSDDRAARSPGYSHVARFQIGKCSHTLLPNGGATRPARSYN